jgi:hypothetical protein
MPAKALRLALVSATIAVTAVVAGAAKAGGTTANAAPALGHWTLLSGTSSVPGGTPAIWQDAQHRATVLWLRQYGPSDFSYPVAQIAANGSVGATTDAFAGGHWGSLSNEPSLVGQAGKPLVVFSGLKGNGVYALGCIYGADGSSQPWTLETWSLSNDCVNPVGSAAANSAGTVAAAWGAGTNVNYRIGTSPTIPATGPDPSIPIGANGFPYKTGIVADAGGSDDFYIAWAKANSNPAANDGYYVKDVTAGGATLKAPGSTTNSINRLGQFADLAIAARLGHPGVYIAYCTGSTKCNLKLWHVGSSSALALPSSPTPGSVSIAAGPAGRIWVGWYDESTNKVYVTRSNEKVSRFGPVRKYSTPCVEHGLLGLSSGSSGRLDIAMQCVNTAVKGAEYATQVEVGLHLAASPATVRNTSQHTITMTVTDVGDPVSGATVRFDGQTRTTSASGTASFTVAKHASPGNYAATATKSQYLSAKTSVRVTS